MRALLILVFSIATIVGLTAHSVSADRHVVCVQEQLLEAGIDAGTADGLLGRKTHAGLSELLNKYPSLDELPKISVANASVYCRAIGLTRGSKSGWSSTGGIIKFVPGKILDAGSLQRLDSIATEVTAFYEEQLGVLLPHSIAFVVSSSAKEAAKLAVSELREQGSNHNVYKSFQDWCGGYSYCGKSYGGVVAVSFSDSSKFPEMNVRKLLAHELAHEIQAQYVGNYRAGGDERRIQQRGPKWLTEAAAIALDMKFRYPNTAAKYQIKPLKLKRQYTAKRLKGFRSQDSAEASDFEDYSAYAGLLLASQSSHAAFLNFWEKTPELGWKKAFEAAFGMTLNEFYAEFGT